MKKSQVVATLAIASAMGVVAPLASTANALKVTNNQVGSQAGEATCGELMTAVSFLEGQAGYTWYDDRAAADKKVTDGDYADITDGQNLWVNVLTNTASITFGTTNQYETDFEDSVKGIAKGVTLTDAEGNTISENSIAAVRNMRAAVNGNKFYQNIKPIIDDLNDGANAATLAGHVRAFKESGLPGAANLVLNENTILADYANGAAIDTVYGAGAFAWFNSLANLMNTVNAQYDKAVAGKGAFEKLLNQPGILAEASVAAFQNYDKDTNPTVVANLRGMANNTADLSATTNAWNSVRSDIASYVPAGSPDGTPICTDNTLVSQNFARVWDLATWYKTITGSNKNIEDVAADLVQYVAPVEPENPDNKPGDNTGDNNQGSNNGSTNAGDKNNTSAAGTIDAGKGSANKNGTPNTGVAMTVAEGASAQSAGIVSVLMSAIAAAGAGLTALRRNKKNA